MNGVTDADVKSGINKARNSFAVLKPIWKSRKITLRTRKEKTFQISVIIRF